MRYLTMPRLKLISQAYDAATPWRWHGILNERCGAANIIIEQVSALHENTGLAAAMTVQHYADIGIQQAITGSLRVEATWAILIHGLNIADVGAGGFKVAMQAQAIACRS